MIVKRENASSNTSILKIHTTTEKKWVDWISTRQDKMLKPQKRTFWGKPNNFITIKHNNSPFHNYLSQVCSENTNWLSYKDC